MLIVSGKENQLLETVTSKIIFIHYLQNCALTTTGKQLPKWGFEQQEVTCNPNVRDKSAVWNVEDNIFTKCECCCENAFIMFIFGHLKFPNFTVMIYCNKCNIKIV